MCDVLCPSVVGHFLGHVFPRDSVLMQIMDRAFEQELLHWAFAGIGGVVYPAKANGGAGEYTIAQTVIPTNLIQYKELFEFVYSSDFFVAPSVWGHGLETVFNLDNPPTPYEMSTYPISPTGKGAKHTLTEDTCNLSFLWWYLKGMSTAMMATLCWIEEEEIIAGIASAIERLRRFNDFRLWATNVNPFPMMTDVAKREAIISAMGGRTTARAYPDKKNPNNARFIALHDIAGSAYFSAMEAAGGDMWQPRAIAFPEMAYKEQADRLKYENAPSTPAVGLHHIRYMAIETGIVKESPTFSLNRAMLTRKRVANGQE